MLIRENQEALDKLIKKLRPAEKPKAPPQRGESTLDDNRLIDKILESGNGDKIHKLLDGDWSGYGSQSEADLAFCNSLAFWTGNSEGQIDRIFRTSALMRDKWDTKHFSDGRTYGQATIHKAIVSTSKTYTGASQRYDKAVKQRKGSEGGVDVSTRVRQYLLDEFDGGVFKIRDLQRDLNLSDKEYTLARQCVKRMVASDEVEKHGLQLGCYRVVDKKKECIDWDATEAKASDIILPAGLHKVAIIRDGDMVAIAGYKNHAKSAFAIETVRLNLNKFKIHFFITEYRARMKQRLLDFGVDLHHPNLFAYQIEKSDYIPDKIESGEGVLNVIDHLPNLDNFYLVGKTQDEIHRGLDGAISVITHQKKNPDDLDAIGGSFWTVTPTLAITLFWDDAMTYPGRMLIRKGKEPGNARNSITNLASRYLLSRGSQFEYDENGWRF
ncbi:MAG: hypothetical protein HQ551_04600 [Desulfobacteraceae bacterium]|nr:hypothetical protein [Desulfobacteraceae bacterium]